MRCKQLSGAFFVILGAFSVIPKVACALPWPAFDPSSMLTKSCQARTISKPDDKHTPVETPTKPPATRARQMHLVPAYVRNLEPHLRMHVAMPAQHAQPLPKPGRNLPRPAQPADKARKLFARKRPSSVVIFCDKDAAPWAGGLFDKAIKDNNPIMPVQSGAYCAYSK